MHALSNSLQPLPCSPPPSGEDQPGQALRLVLSWRAGSRPTCARFQWPNTIECIYYIEMQKLLKSANPESWKHCSKIKDSIRLMRSDEWLVSDWSEATSDWSIDWSDGLTDKPSIEISTFIVVSWPSSSGRKSNESDNRNHIKNQMPPHHTLCC